MNEPAPDLGTTYVRLGRSLLVGVLAGIPSGLLVGGLGSRVVMRIAAIAGGPAIAGAKTENGNVVGQFTLDGNDWWAGFFCRSYFSRDYGVLRDNL